MMNEVKYEIKNKNQDDLNFKHDFSKNEDSETLTLKNFHFNEEKRKLKTEEKNRIFLYYIIIIFSFLIIIGAFFLLLHMYNNTPHLILDDKNILKPLTDQNAYRIIRLKNKISAILISNKDDKESHFSLTVPTGSYDDQEFPGLAHLTEHIVFSYKNLERYLRKNDGYMESYTKDDRTTFYYKILNEHFPISLLKIKKHIQFPDFSNHSRIEVEIDHIENEYKKNKQSNIWKQYQILKSISNEKNPFYNFNLGNKEIFFGSVEFNKKLKRKLNLTQPNISFFFSDKENREAIYYLNNKSLHEENSNMRGGSNETNNNIEVIISKNIKNESQIFERRRRVNLNNNFMKVSFLHMNENETAKGGNLSENKLKNLKIFDLMSKVPLGDNHMKKQDLKKIEMEMIASNNFTKKQTKSNLISINKTTKSTNHTEKINKTTANDEEKTKQLNTSPFRNGSRTRRNKTSKIKKNGTSVKKLNKNNSILVSDSSNFSSIKINAVKSFKNLKELEIELEKKLSFLSSKIEDFFFKNYKVNDIVIIAKSNLNLDDLSGLINDAFNDLNWDKNNDYTNSNNGDKEENFENSQKYFSNSEDIYVEKILPNLTKVVYFKAVEDDIKNVSSANNFSNTIISNKSKIKNVTDFNNNNLRNETQIKPEPKPLDKKNFNLIPPFNINNLSELIIFNKNSIKNTASLDYFFPLNTENLINDKPNEFLSYILKYDSMHSLVDKLKKDKLIENLNVDMLRLNKKASLYVISIELSNDDERLIPIVNNYLFQFLDIIKSCFYKNKEEGEVILDDVKKILKIKFELFDFTEEIESVEQIFARIYENYFKHKKQEVLYGEFNATDTNFNTISSFLKNININNSIVMYGSPKKFSDLKYIKNLFMNQTAELRQEVYYNSTYIIGKLNDPINSIHTIFDNSLRFIENGKKFYDNNSSSNFTTYSNKYTNRSIENSFDDTNMTNRLNNFNKSNIDTFNKRIDGEFNINLKSNFDLNRTIIYQSNNDMENISIYKFSLNNIFDCSHLRKKNFFITNNIDFARFEKKNKNMYKSVDINGNSGSVFEVYPSEDKNYDNDTSDVFSTGIPVLLIDKMNSKLYYMKDETNNTNQVSVTIELIFPEAKSDLNDISLLNIYFEMIKNFLKKYYFDALIAGNQYHLDLSDYGIRLKIIAFEDILAVMTKQYLSFVASEFSLITLDSDAFTKFKNKANKRIIKSLKVEKNVGKIEKEIFNKIIKYNYTNHFDLVDFNLDPKLTKEAFLEGIKRIKSKMFFKGLIIGKFLKMKNLDLVIKKISKSIKESKENMRSLNPTYKILDDSYIYRTQVNSKYINQPCIMNLYQYGGIFDDPKTYATLRLLETFMNLQFSKNDLIGFKIQDLEDFEQSVLALDGTYMFYKFFAVTSNIKAFNKILNKSLIKFKNEFNYISNYNLQEFKNILTNEINEQRSQIKKISKKADKYWNRLDKIEEVDIIDYLPNIVVADIKKLYERMFLESKILSLQVFPVNLADNTPQLEIPKFKDEEYDKDDNIVMKVVYNYKEFSNLDSYNQENLLYYNSTVAKSDSDDD